LCRKVVVVVLIPDGFEGIASGTASVFVVGHHVIRHVGLIRGLVDDEDLSALPRAVIQDGHVHPRPFVVVVVVVDDKLKKFLDDLFVVVVITLRSGLEPIQDSPCVFVPLGDEVGIHVLID
jgi:hypothetical protein